MADRYQQQDSQELFNFLMDGLHEDLNRVKNKPYVEGLDQKEGETEEEYSAAEWGRYKLRNESVVVDMMRGQLKSHLVCPKTNKEAVKFDPFISMAVRHADVMLTWPYGS